MLGIYEVSIKKICFETGLNKDVVLKSFDTFKASGKIRYEHNYIILVNFIKHQNYNPNMKKAAIECYCNLPNELKIKDLDLTILNPLEAFETLSNRLGMVRKVEVEYEEESEDKSNPKATDINSTTLLDCEKLFLEKTANNWTIEFAKKEAFQFFNFYASKGWKVGDNKMKSLTHAIGGWIGRVDKPELEGKLDLNQESEKDYARRIWRERNMGI